jgi:hypothetical protein
MKLHAFILALDAMPYIRHQVETFRTLTCDWHLHIIEGVADNVLDTSWCSKITPRLSRDGTTEFLHTLRSDPRISIYHRTLWPGKVSMCNTALATIKDECCLLQADADEFHTPQQLETISHLFDGNTFDSARFYCRYFLGPDIIATGENCWSNQQGEWLRCWRFHPGQYFEKHEPPVLRGGQRNCIPRTITRAYGLVFDHFAYATRAQCMFKARYYGYTNLVEQWERLQANTEWPIKRLADWLPFVGEGVGADILK